MLARDVPSLGWRSYRLASSGSRPLAGNALDGGALTSANEHYRLRVDPPAAAAVSSLVEVSSGRELLADGEVGNELVVYDEYPAHPEFGEGPWHLLPKGPVRRLVRSAGLGAGVPRPARRAAGDPRPHR